MSVVCNICSGPARFNSLIGVYFCPDHGFETQVRVVEAVSEPPKENISRLKHLPEWL